MKRGIAMVLAAIGTVQLFPGELPAERQIPASREGEREVASVAKEMAAEWRTLDLATEGVVAWVDMAGKV